MRRLGALVSLLALVALGGGCGNTYTKKDFVDQADAICAGAVRKTRVVPPPSFAGSPRQRLASLADYLGKVVPIAESEAKDIHALKTPPGSDREKATLQRYLDALDGSVAAYGRLQTAARAGDTQGVAAAEAALRAGRVSPLATRYGLRSCAVPGSTGV